MKLYAAPLQGFTEAPWRNLHQEVFGGIDAYYTPFVRMEKGEFRNKDVREIASGNNTVSRLIPQLIASTPAELERLAGLFIEKGYKEADINMGCPFPLMTGKHKGSGILPYPAEVEALLKELVHYPELGFSVKMRLGWECADEWRPLLPLLLSLIHICCLPIPCSFLYTPLSFRNCLRLLLALLRCHNCKSLPSNAPGALSFLRLLPASKYQSFFLGRPWDRK